MTLISRRSLVTIYTAGNGSAWIAVVWSAWMLGTSQVAAAQSSSTLPEKRSQPVNSARALKLFNDGKAAEKNGDYDKACKSYEASMKEEATLATRLHLADCLASTGRKATAYNYYRLAKSELANLDGRIFPGAEKERESVINKMRDLELKMSNLEIEVPEDSQIDGLEVRCGTEVVAEGDWNRALPRDAGIYTITASAPGRVQWTTEVTLGPVADNKPVRIPRLQRSRLPQRAFAAGSAVLFGVAAGYYLSSVFSYHDAEHEMVNQARRNSLLQDAQTRRNIALGFGLAGLASGGVAAWLYVRSGQIETSMTASHRAHVHIIPSLVGTSGTGIVVLGQF